MVEQIEILQNNVDVLVVKINGLMNTIIELDKYCDETEDPEQSYLIAGVIAQKGPEFEECMLELESALIIFLDKQKELGLPINMSYARLKSQINKAAKD